MPFALALSNGLSRITPLQWQTHSLTLPAQWETEPAGNTILTPQAATYDAR